MIKFISSITVSSLVVITGLLLASPSYAVGDQEIDNPNIVTEDDCLPAVLLFRGSSEDPQAEPGKPPIVPDPKKYYQEVNGQESHFITTNHYEGLVIEKLLTSFVNQTDPAFTVSKTRFIGVKYEALPVFPSLDSEESLIKQGITIGHHVVKYQNSYNNGAKKAVEFIQNDIRNGCNTTYMFAGYSQGAISARIALEMLGNNEDKVVSTYLVGDPVNDAGQLLSNRQASPAHNREDSDGVLRYGLEWVSKSRFFSNVGEGAQNYLDKFSSSDSIVYRDNGINPSRVLCHEDDLVCDFDKGSNLDNHLNYFQSKVEEPNNSGNIDLQYEINEFDKQVQALASSQGNNPRARVLKKTPSVNTSTTLYNLANSQMGDTCSWDEGNDGTYEQNNIPCEIYEYENTSQTERLRVKVTDTYGSNYFFELEDEVLEVEQIEHVLTLDPNSWYQFKVKEMPLTERDRNDGYYYDDEKEAMVFDEYWEPSFTGEQCIEWSYQDPYSIIDNHNWNMDLMDCKTKLQSGNAFDAMQVFKPSKEGIKSGYDTDYSWGRDDIIEEYSTLVPHANNNETFKPLLTEIINNTPYYSFRNQNNCITAKDNEAGYTNLFIEICTDNNNAQLFEAKKINGDYGSLSLEKDTTPPKEPNNLLLEVDNNAFSMMIWDKVEDRGIETKYELYKLTSNPTRYSHYDTYYPGEVRAKDLYAESIPLGQEKTYAIRAVDDKGLFSPYAHITVNRITEPVKKPTKPVLSTIHSDNSNITLTLPTYNTNQIRGVRVYDNEEYLGTYTGTTITLPVIPGATHNYTYRYEVNDQIVSVLSNKLRVIIPTN